MNMDSAIAAESGTKIAITQLLPPTIRRITKPRASMTSNNGRRGATPDRKSTRLNPVTNAHLVCRLLLEKKKKNKKHNHDKQKQENIRQHTQQHKQNSTTRVQY